VINDNKYGFGDVEYVIEEGYYFREISECSEEEGISDKNFIEMEDLTHSKNLTENPSVNLNRRNNHRSNSIRQRSYDKAQ